MRGQRHAPATLYPRERHPYPLYRRLGGPQGRSGRAENLVPSGIRSPDRPARRSVTIPTELPGPLYIYSIRSRTVQPVAQSLYLLSYPAHCVSVVFRRKMKFRNPLTLVSLQPDASRVYTSFMFVCLFVLSDTVFAFKLRPQKKGYHFYGRLLALPCRPLSLSEPI